MRLIIIPFLMVFLFVTGKSNAQTELSCPELQLLKTTPAKQLHGSMNGSKEPLYMSEHYCFVYYKPDPEDRYPSTKFHLVDKRFMLSRTTGMNIAKSYTKAYSWINGTDQKLSFAHFYLQKLTQTALVTPRASDDKRTEIYIAVNISRSHHRFILTDFAKDMGDLEALHKLNQMQDNPPKAEDYPVLSKLVDTVLEGKEVISDDKLYEITSKL